MSEAEEKAWEWSVKNKLDPYSIGRAYAEGYHQAEKDLELTYDDICEIMEIREDVLEMDSYENLYEEILKRFKEKK